MVDTHSHGHEAQTGTKRQKIAVLVIHGLGNQESGYAEEFTRPIYKGLMDHWAGDPRNPADDIVFQPVYWAPLLQWRQNDLLLRFDTHFKLDYRPLRRLFAAGALTSYVVPSDEGPHRKYYGITAIGRSQLKQQRDDWDHFAATVSGLLAHTSEGIAS